MYYVDGTFRPPKKKEIFETLEEALADAQEQASKNYDTDFSYIVNKMEAVVKVDPEPMPTKTVKVTTETAHLIENNEDN